MARYNVVFQYLLRLKRIQGDLESSWAVMRRQAGRSRDLPLHTRRLPLWHLRHHMAYIIANLQIYVQVSLHTIGMSLASLVSKTATPIKVFHAYMTSARPINPCKTHASQSRSAFGLRSLNARSHLA